MGGGEGKGCIKYLHTVAWMKWGWGQEGQAPSEKFVLFTTEQVTGIVLSTENEIALRSVRSE